MTIVDPYPRFITESPLRTARRHAEAELRNHNPLLLLRALMCIER